MFFCFKTRIIKSNPPTSFPPKINKAVEYAGGRKIGLERVNASNGAQFVAQFQV
jgi:hypothetical protein